jgi:protein transport protein SEC61 subunit gamma-like protein
MVKEFFQNCKRLLQVARKPDQEEYFRVAKITGIGILLIGGLGFLIMFVSLLIQGG